jgi:hypothetical protein
MRLPARSTLLLLLLGLTLGSAPAWAQETKIRGFADINVAASDAPGGAWGFRLGQFDTFITSKLAERWSFLSEAVFEFRNDFVVDVERLIVTYRASEQFEVSAGKHHTPFGYWNTAYHHGTLLQPTIDRPLMFKFEDDGGPLPVHTTGVMAAGRDMTSWHLGYDIMIGNGIGSTPRSDNNAAKSVTISLHSQVTSVLRIGASYYYDRISAGTPALSDTLRLGESLRRDMYGGFVAYLGPRYEALGEYQRVTDEGATAGRRSSDLYYVYGGVRVGNVTSYAELNDLRFAVGDAYFDTGNRRLGVIGARYDVASTAALKAEYHRARSGNGAWANEVAVQVAIGF